jgi:hypothetical protein
MTNPLIPGPVPGRRKHAQDRLATGAPRYGLGGSNAATIGTVDPTGYVERSRRSGLARSLLSRQQGPTGQGPAAQAPGADGSQLVGQTASRTPTPEIVRRLAARMQRPTKGV